MSGIASLLVLYGHSAYGQTEGLFTDISTPIALQSAEDSVADATGATDEIDPDDWNPRHGPARRSVRIDLEQLDTVQARLDGSDHPRLRLNLFDDLVVTAVFDRTSPTRFGYSLSGRIEGLPVGTVTLVVNDGVVAGRVRTGLSVYAIRNIGLDTHMVEEIESPTFSTDDMLLPIELETGSDSARRTAVDAEDDGSEIDVFVFWTRDARNAVGGLARMRAEIDLAVAETNNAYLTSGAEQQINLVGAAETNFEEYGDSEIDLRRFRSDPAAATIRNSYAADLVHLITGRGSEPGIAFITLLGGAPEAFAYGVTDVHQTNVPGLVFAHELGHNMGLLHDRFNDPSNEPFPYSHGYVNQKAFEQGATPDACWYTVMAYDRQCYVEGGFTRPIWIPRFSNPGHSYPDEDGDPMGVPGDEASTEVEGPADAARSLNETRRRIANFRASAEGCAYRLSERQRTVAAEGGVFVVGVDTAPECAFEAQGHEAFLSPIADSDNEVRYRVLPNSGAARIGSISVAGEMLTVRQSGVAPAAVCERTPAIRNAIVDRTGRGDCEAVSEFDLLEIADLSLAGLDIAKLQPNDLAGLANLRMLDLSHNELRTFPEFREFPRLRELDLSGNELTGTIPQEIGTLSHLTRLDLSRNRLIGVPPPELRNLWQLHYLRLDDNEFSGPIPEFLGGMSSLKWIDLADNRFTGSIPQALRRLSSLRLLVLSDNDLTGTIPHWLGELGSLHTLILARNSLTGSIPAALGETRLGSLVLGGNELTGAIPPEIGKLSRLWRLHLDNNRLTGAIPPALGDLANLLDLTLRHNELTGAIPPELRALSQLRHLGLRDNRLTGCVPPGLSDVASHDLDELGLPTCDAVLTIEAGDGTDEEERDESTRSIVEGAEAVFTVAADPVPASRLEVPVSIAGGADFGVADGTRTVTVRGGEAAGVLTITTVDDDVEEPDGRIDASLEASEHYAVMDSRNSASVLVLDSEGPSAPTIHTVTPGDTTLTVEWDPPSLKADAIESYEVRHRHSPRSGVSAWTIESVDKNERRHVLRNLTNRRSYDVQVRGVAGGAWSKVVTGTPRFCIDIADSDCRVLLAAKDALAGDGTPLNWRPDLPVSDWDDRVELDAAGRVVLLWLHEKDLRGVIPPTLGNLSALRQLYLGYCGLSGGIPGELGNLRKLEVLSLRGNELSGPIPSGLGDLPNLRSLSIAENELTGTIPPTFGNLSSLGSLQLMDNELSGTIPAELGNLARLGLFNARDNNLSGPIPPELGRLSNLWAITLQGNELTGTIPPSLGSLPQMKFLRLEGNRLSGAVPAELVNLRLRQLRLADNPLECVPAKLRNVPDHDLDALGVPDCGPGVTDLLIDSRPRDGDAYRVGEQIWVSVVFDSELEVSGVPQLALMIGSAIRQSSLGYHWRNKLAFSYDVVAADRDDDGFGVATDAMRVVDGTIRGLDGTRAKLDLGLHGFANDHAHRVLGAVPLPPGEAIELVGYGDRVDLARAFSTVSGGLVFDATVSDETLLTIAVRGRWLEVVPNEDGEEGTATVTVTARNAAGEVWSWEFDVVVVPGRRGLPVWLRALGHAPDGG